MTTQLIFGKPVNNLQKIANSAINQIMWPASLIDPPWSGIFPKSFNFESLKQIVQAIVYFFQKQEKEQAVNLLIASDGSPLTKRLVQIATRVIVNAGSKLISSANPIPISTFSFAIRHYRLSGGIYLACDPGDEKLCRILLFDRLGKIALPSITAIIADYYFRKLQNIRHFQAYADLEMISEIDPKTDYLNKLQEQIEQKTFAVKRVKIVLDHFFGTSRDLFENLLNTFGLEIISLNRSTIFCTPGKQFTFSRKTLINLQKEVNEKNGLVGVAIDPHCQKAVFYQKNRFFSIDDLFPPLLYYLYTQRQIKTPVIHTLNDSFLIDLISKHFRIPIVRSAAGAKFIALELEDFPNCFAGFERNSGLIWKSLSCYPDGLLFALLVIEMIFHYQQPLEKILNSFYKIFPKSYYRKMMIKNSEKFACNYDKLLNNQFCPEQCQSREIIDGIRFNFSDGWLLIRRLSGSSCYQIAAESLNRSKLSRLITRGIDCLEKGS